jgi:hypothetical protein
MQPNLSIGRLETRKKPPLYANTSDSEFNFSMTKKPNLIDSRSSNFVSKLKVEKRTPKNNAVIESTLIVTNL